jgi:hypothetical protein
MTSAADEAKPVLEQRTQSANAAAIMTPRWVR